MERLRCKACGSYSMVPMDVSIEEEEEGVGVMNGESRFYTCHVCGDNWLSVREDDEGGDSRITFVHQMGLTPILKRVAYLKKDTVLRDTAVEKWDYFFDEENIEEFDWQDKLADRRRMLKSICSN